MGQLQTGLAEQLREASRRRKSWHGGEADADAVNDFAGREALRARHPAQCQPKRLDLGQVPVVQFAAAGRGRLAGQPGGQTRQPDPVAQQRVIDTRGVEERRQPLVDPFGRNYGRLRRRLSEQRVGFATLVESMIVPHLFCGHWHQRRIHELNHPNGTTTRVDVLNMEHSRFGNGVLVLPGRSPLRIEPLEIRGT